MNTDFSSPMRDNTARGTLAGRGTVVGMDDLRGDFADALKKVLCEDEAVEEIFAVRSDRILRVVVPATVLVVTDRALFILRESPHLGVRVAVFPYSALGAIDIGHDSLFGSLWFRFVRRATVVPQLTASDLRGSTLGVVYHLLDEPAIFQFVRRLRELADRYRTGLTR